MTRTNDRVKWIAMALVAVALLGVATPVCAMPECDDTSAGTCSDFMPACDECPDAVVMKHVHDDAVGVTAVQLEAPVVLSATSALPVPMAPSPCLAAPVATASPPPVEPLGVRLTL